MSISPYIGLRPYTYEERDKFFGRDDDIHILLDKVMANRLTLLFAASGVGKSSLLAAGLVPQLREAAGYDVVYFRDWAADAELELKQAVVAALAESLPAGHAPNWQLPLAEFLRRYTVFCADTLVVILDQFEEFFHYRRLRADAEPFLSALAAALQDRLTPTVFVISMREDFALELNALKRFYPEVFENFYRLERLSPAAARVAMVQPLAQVGFAYEPALLKELLACLSRREQIDYYGLSEALRLKDAPLRVEPPHLQIICGELWVADQGDVGRLLRLATYERLGGAERILDVFFQNKMRTLSHGEQRLASQAFDLLVNKHGTKMSYPLPDLAAKLRVDVGALGAVLEKLAAVWVLRRQERQVVQAEGKVVWFELYHDVFALIAYTWNEAFKARLRRWRWGMRLSGLVLVGAVAVLGYDWGVNRFWFSVQIDPQTDRVEVYQGVTESWDVFGQRGFGWETGWQRWDLEADKRFDHQVAPSLEVLLPEMIGDLPLADRVAAYLENGFIQEGLGLAEAAISARELHLAEQLFAHLTVLRTYKSVSMLEKYSTEETENILKQRLAETTERLAPSGQAIVDMLLELLKQGHQDAAATFVLFNIQQVIPDLTILLKDESHTVRYIAIATLGELNAQQAIRDLMPLLKNENEDIRYKTAYALLQLNAPKIIPHFIELLKDESKKVKMFAIYALGQLNAQQAIPELTNLLINFIDMKYKDDEINSLLSTLANALSKLNAKEIEPKLISLLKSDDSDVRGYVIELLGKLKAYQALPDLLELIKDGGRFSRTYENYLFKKLKKAKLYPYSFELPERICDIVSEVLHDWDYQKAIPDLMLLLKNNKSGIRKCVINALGKLNAQQATPNLIPLLSDTDNRVRENVVDALGKLNAQKAVSNLIPLLNDKDDKVRYITLDVLGKLNAQQAIPNLIPLLSHKDNHVRRNVIHALGELNAQQAIPNLMPLLKDNHVRSSLADTLGKLNVQHSIEDLVKLLDQHNDHVRASAANALAQLQAIYSALPLSKMLKLDTGNKYRDLNNQEIAAFALHKLGIHAVLPYIQRIEQEIQQDEDTRQGLEELEAELKFDLPATPQALHQLILTPNTPKPEKVAALRALGNQATPEAAQLILDAKNNLPPKDYDFFIIQALGKSRQPAALPYLNQHRQQLETDKQNWRKLRDTPNRTKDQDNRYKQLSPKEYMEAEVAYAIAKCDLDQGIKLLAHPFYQIRVGAWLGLGHTATANTLEKLITTFHQTPVNQPFTRQALYRAIDTGLITVEVTGSEHDLKQLTTRWHQERQNQDQKQGQDWAIAARLEWTVARMEERLVE